MRTRETPLSEEETGARRCKVLFSLCFIFSSRGEDWGGGELVSGQGFELIGEAVGFCWLEAKGGGNGAKGGQEEEGFEQGGVREGGD